MLPNERLTLLSPLDHRYFLANEELFTRLQSYLSEDAAVRAVVRVEAALLRHLCRRLLPKEEAVEVQEALADIEQRIDPGEVYEEERTTRHNVRAVVNVMQRHVPPNCAHLVHLGATSVDMLDTAASLRYSAVTHEVILPLVLEVIEALAAIVESEQARASIGRTHGQFAVPITVGFALAEYLSRLSDSAPRIATAAGELRGKLSGAVGAYNATSVLTSDPEELEREVLAELGLTSGEHATQIVAPEPLLRLLLEMNVAFGVLANLADDLRNLQRSEIGEFSEFFAAGQVGSSTMPHKRNPWNAEHVKSLWKAFAPRAMTWYMDQISEHQRDLTNSASGRFVAEYIAGFAAAMARMHSILTRLRVDSDGIERNLRAGAERVVAEPLYILLAAAGQADAHERVRALTLRADESGQSVLEVARADGELWQRVDATAARLTGSTADELFGDPQRYLGRARERAALVVDNARERVRRIRAASNRSA